MSSADSPPPQDSEPHTPPRASPGGGMLARLWRSPTACTLRRWTARIALGYAAVVLMIALLQRKLIYQPTRCGRLEAATVNRPAGSVHDIAVTTHDGLTLHGWHFLSRQQTAHSEEELQRHLQQTRWVVLYFHGNGGNRRNRQRLAEAFTNCGADVFLFDYRGYAENPGRPSERDFLADANSIWRYATRQRRIPASRIVLFGESLGGGLVIPLAAEVCAAGTPPAGIVLWGTFSSLTEVARRHFPWLPVRWLLQDRYDSLAHAAAVTCPILQMHGSKDEIVPMDVGRELFEAFPGHSQSGRSKIWIEIPHCGHNDLSAERLQAEVVNARL